MISKFRAMRLHCHIKQREVAEAAEISAQRLNQYETRHLGFKPRDPERLIKALEKVLAKRRKELETVEHICKQERETVFDYITGGDKL